MQNLKLRCEWCGEDPLYQKYHDEEWGVSVHDDNKLFEFLVLEGAQAGLSWLTVLRKRENYRRAFDGFDPVKISNYNLSKIEELLKNEGIIRSKLKVNSAVRNAKVFLEIQKEFGSFDSYLWGFVSNQQIKNSFSFISELPAKTDLSDEISKDLKKRGMNFVGSTIIYAYMQAVGLINDHVIDCFSYKLLVTGEYYAKIQNTNFVFRVRKSLRDYI